MRTGFTDGSGDKEYASNEGDRASIPGLGRSPGEGNGYPLQYFFFFFCLEKSMGRGKSPTQPDFLSKGFLVFITDHTVPKIHSGELPVYC